jgi:hypothetical protein
MLEHLQSSDALSETPFSVYALVYQLDVPKWIFQTRLHPTLLERPANTSESGILKNVRERSASLVDKRAH